MPWHQIDRPDVTPEDGIDDPEPDALREDPPEDSEDQPTTWTQIKERRGYESADGEGDSPPLPATEPAHHEPSASSDARSQAPPPSAGKIVGRQT